MDAHLSQCGQPTCEGEWSHSLCDYPTVELRVTHRWLPLRGGVGRQKRDIIGRRGWGVSKYSGRPIFIFLIKKNWICAMTRNQAGPNINILLTRNLPFDSDVRQWSHLLTIPLHCLTRGQFEFDMLGFAFVLIAFVLRCCSIISKKVSIFCHQNHFTSILHKTFNNCCIKLRLNTKKLKLKLKNMNLKITLLISWSW